MPTARTNGAAYGASINFSSLDSARWAATMVAVAPTLVARSQRSRSVRAIAFPHPKPKNIDSLVSITVLIGRHGGTTLRPVTDFAQRTIELARRNVAEGGRPFATVIVNDGEILAESANKVAQNERSDRARGNTGHQRGVHEARDRAPGRQHHLCAGPPVPDVPGFAVLLLAQGSHLPDHARVLRAVLPG